MLLCSHTLLVRSTIIRFVVKILVHTHSIITHAQEVILIFSFTWTSECFVRVLVRVLVAYHEDTTPVNVCLFTLK